MKRKQWRELLSQQPHGLSGAELARRINKSNALTIYWANKLKCRIIDGRKHPKPEKFDSIRKVHIKDIDWSQTNQAIASKHGIARQRVWQLRQRVEV